MKHEKKSRNAQYDHLKGNPLDPANHPAANVPDATIPYGGTQLQNPTQPPSIPGAMAFDSQVG